jgi:RNA polymerase sigma-70 factor (ECF subfamily)
VSDQEIIKKVQSGETESFSLLVEKYHRRLLNFIYNLVGDERIVEDIGQEVFLSVYKSIRGFDVDRGTPFSVWLFITARNRCISELRRRRPPSLSVEDGTEILPDDYTPEQKAIDNELIRSIRASLEGLPEPYRSTIIQSLKGTQLRDIALKQGVSLGTIKSRIARAREKMKLTLNEHFGGR